MNFSKLYSCCRMQHRNCIKRVALYFKPHHENHVLSCRNFSFEGPNPKSSNLFRLKSTKNYMVAIGVTALGLSYAAVPLYRIFCQSFGYAGTVQHDIGGEKVEKLEKIPDRKISIKFTSDVSTHLKWKFEPQQAELVVIPGETALAFYTATNPTDRPIIGISTYNIIPYSAASYFNKIQCFCFEEQMLNPKEQVDMPVFFYIDPDFCEDPLMENVNEIILSYTFFEAKGSYIPSPPTNSTNSTAK